MSRAGEYGGMIPGRRGEGDCPSLLCGCSDARCDSTWRGLRRTSAPFVHRLLCGRFHHPTRAAALGSPCRHESAAEFLQLLVSSGGVKMKAIGEVALEVAGSLGELD